MLGLALALLLQDVDKKDQTEAWLEQIAQGLKLYAEFNGAYPEKLEDLVIRPKGAKLWPDGGYLLVPEAPKDPWGRAFAYDGKTVKSLGPDEKSDEDDLQATLPKIAASSAADAIALTRIVKLDLIRTAVIARRRATRTLPETMKDLTDSPFALVREKSLTTPYGALTLKGSKECVRLTLSAAAVKPEAPTEDDRARFEALVKDLGSDDAEVRDTSSKGIVEMGARVLPLFKDRKDSDPEVAARLAAAEKEIRKPLEALAATPEAAAFVFKAPDVSILPGIQSARIASNERNAATSLKATVTAEENLKGNDVDRNGIGDYWTADLRGLYCLKFKATNRPTACLSDLGMVYADTSPVPAKTFEGIDMDGDGVPDTAYDASDFKQYLEFPKPKAGYLYKALVRNEQGELYAQDTGNTGIAVQNFGEYGFCAYPAEYGATGKYTFIVNNIGSVLRKDTRGRPVESWPTDKELGKPGWDKVE